MKLIRTFPDIAASLVLIAVLIAMPARSKPDDLPPCDAATISPDGAIVPNRVVTLGNVATLGPGSQWGLGNIFNGRDFALEFATKCNLLRKK